MGFLRSRGAPLPFVSPPPGLSHEGYWGDPDDFRYVYGDEDRPSFLSDGGKDWRRSLRRKAPFVGALLCALALHACLLLFWRDMPPARLEAVGRDDGGGGISLSLVSGVAGADFASTSGAHMADAAHEADARAAELTDPSAETRDVNGQAGEEPSAPGDGHDSGGAAGTAEAGTQSLVGTGINPSAYPSFAPLSFQQVSEPGLFEQVRRCLKTYSPTDTAFLVILNDAGELVGAYPQPSGELNTTGNNPQAVSDALEAVKACSPYHDIKAGLSKPLTLVIPAYGHPGATSLQE